MKQKLSDLIAIAGLLFMVVMSIQFLFIHFISVLNGLQYGHWGTTVLINAFGEATFETICYIITIPLITFCIIHYLKQFSTKYHRIPEPRPNTLYYKLTKAGNVTFWTTIIMTSVIIICLIITWRLNQ